MDRERELKRAVGDAYFFGLLTALNSVSLVLNWTGRVEIPWLIALGGALCSLVAFVNVYREVSR